MFVLRAFMKFSLLYLLLPFYLSAQSGSFPLPGQPGEAESGQKDEAYWVNLFDEGLSGYLEDTLNLEYLKATKETAQLNNLKLRLNTGGEITDSFRFGLSFIGVSNTGDREFGLTGYLPERVENQIPEDWRSAYGYQLQNESSYLQEAYGEWVSERVSLRFGRHKFYSGTGYAYNPIDLFNRKNPVDPTYETNGQDAVLLTLKLDSGTEIEAVVRSEDDYKNLDAQARVKGFIGDWDVAAGLTRCGKKRIDWIMGGMERKFVWNMVSAEFSGEVMGVGLYGEGGWVMVDKPDDPGSLSRAGRDHARLLIGMDYTFESQLYVMAEYLRLGQGREGADELDLNDRFAYLTGEILSTNKDTLFLGASYPLTDLIDFSLYGIVNCNESSLILNPWIIWDLHEGLKLSASMSIPAGDDEGSNGRMGISGFLRLRYSF
jgi:hypothetical protein